MNFYEFAMNTSMFTSVLWWMAIPTTFIFIVSMIILFFFGGDTDVDAGVDDFEAGDDSPSFRVFSFSNMVAFLMMFSWVTLLLIKMGYIEITSILWGVVSGGGMVLFSIALHFAMKQLETRNTPKINSVVGKKGTIINRIQGPGKQGKIQIIHNGGLKTYDCSADEKINARSHVKVLEVINNTLIVKKVNK